MSNAKDTIEAMFALAGVQINGKRPFDITVRDERLYRRVLAKATLGFGEAYMDGWWDSEQLDEMIFRLLTANLRDNLKLSPAFLRVIVTSLLFNKQNTKRARRNVVHHYDIGNDLYKRMLDKRMAYSCGYWKDAKNLDDAQTAKFDLICRKLHLQPGTTLLDIGCGWGGFANYAAEKYGVKVTGITLATEQLKVAQERAKNLPNTFLLKDYRDMTGTFDCITSIGVMEHIGPKNYRRFFMKCEQLLADDGTMLHHTIGGNTSVRTTDPWIDKYIFPGGVLPSMKQISKATERLLIIEDLQNIGPDYDKTLMAWHHNFVQHYPEIKDQYDERFYRMWVYYLQTCAALFRARETQLWQIVFRKIRPAKTYQRIS